MKMPFTAKHDGIDFEADNRVKGKLFWIEAPYPVRAITRPKDDSEGKGFVTFPMIVPAYYENKDKIIEELTKIYPDSEILDIEQMRFQITNLCPKCKERGTPSIQKKNTDTSYLKQSENYARYKVKGKPSYWLHYWHKDKRKHCWVQQWQGTIQGTFKPIKKRNWLDPEKENKPIDPRLYLLSHAIKEMAKVENSKT